MELRRAGAGWPPSCRGLGVEEGWKSGNSGRRVALATTGTGFRINIASVYRVTSVDRPLPSLDREKLSFVVLEATSQMWMKALLGVLGALLLPAWTGFCTLGPMARRQRKAMLTAPG